MGPRRTIGSAACTTSCGSCSSSRWRVRVDHCRKDTEVKLSLLLLVAALLLGAFIIEIVRRRRLSESYALLWIGVAIAGVALGLARPLVDRLSTTLGVSYGSNLVFGVVCLFLLVVAVNLSVHVSRLEQRVERLAQELALRDGDSAPSDRSSNPDPQ
ncbi:MAG: DUF2304 domain-containing protein [Actinobacteria bacterium]|nr:DUF2304 domain-containing protein [Actinomycetota bacterium]